MYFLVEGKSVSLNRFISEGSSVFFSLNISWQVKAFGYLTDLKKCLIVLQHSLLFF